MLPEKVSNTNIGVGVGIVLQAAGRFLAWQSEAMFLPGIAIAFAGLGCFVWGCFNYAEGKGYSQWLGLLGLLSCFGLFIMVLLPDKNK